MGSPARQAGVRSVVQALTRRASGRECSAGGRRGGGGRGDRRPGARLPRGPLWQGRAQRRRLPVKTPGQPRPKARDAGVRRPRRAPCAAEGAGRPGPVGPRRPGRAASCRRATCAPRASLFPAGAPGRLAPGARLPAAGMPLRPGLPPGPAAPTHSFAEGAAVSPSRALEMRPQGLDIAVRLGTAPPRRAPAWRRAVRPPRRQAKGRCQQADAGRLGVRVRLGPLAPAPRGRVGGGRAGRGALPCPPHGLADGRLDLHGAGAAAVDPAALSPPACHCGSSRGRRSADPAIGPPAPYGAVPQQPSQAQNTHKAAAPHIAYCLTPWGKPRPRRLPLRTAPHLLQIRFGPLPWTCRRPAHG